MSAEVVLENVGGLSGIHNFKFVKGTINVVKAPNAAGKSTIIKAIASCLSAPYRSKSLIEVAREMGLLKQPSEVVEPLIHMGADTARVSIKLNGEEWAFSLSKDGRYTYTREGDERFLVTSVLTRASPILNKLASGDVDFGWVIEAVSLASRYETVARILEKEKNNIYGLYEDVERKRREVESLEKEQIALKEDINKYRREESELNRKLSELLASRPDIGKLRGRRDYLLSRIGEQEDEIERIGRRIEELKREISRRSEKHKAELAEKELLEKKDKILLESIESIERRLKALDKRLEGYEERLKKISEQVETLRIEEGRFLAKNEMYERALKLTTQSQRALCFLCEQGYLTAETLNQRKLLTERQLNEVRDEISALLSERNNIYSALREKDELKDQLNELRRQHTEVTGKLQAIERALSSYSKDVRALHESLAGFDVKLKEAEQTLSKYRAELETIEESIRELGEEEQKIVGNLAGVRGRLKELEKQLSKVERELEVKSYIEVLGRKLSLDDAKKILDAWITTVDSVLKWVQTEVRKERVMAVELFNGQVKRVLKDSGFEYLDVWINAGDYKLHVIDKRIGVEVSPRILSETERYVLAFIIHTTLKLTYTPHVPFFLIDEVVLSFDEARRRATLKYLSDLAEENGWFVILTELGREPKIITSVLTNP